MSKELGIGDRRIGVVRFSTAIMRQRSSHAYSVKSRLASLEPSHQANGCIAMATSVKDRILETLSQLPPTATVEDAMERLYFLAKVERGVADLDAGRVVSHDEIKARLGR